MQYGRQVGRNGTSPALLVALPIFVFVLAAACDRSSESPPSAEEKSAPAGSEETPSGAAGSGDAEEPEGESAGRGDGAAPVRREPSANSSAPTGRPPEPRRVSVGASIEDAIAAPESLESSKLEFETDWYSLDVRSGETVEIAVQPEEGASLQPMVTVLDPDTEGGGTWTEIDARRGTEQGAPVRLAVTFDRAGTKLVTVDDARNLPRIGEREAPETFRGGPGYAYTLTVEHPSADNRDGSP